jgi:DNA-binding transcriptional regulator YhcF (GntR family)
MRLWINRHSGISIAEQLGTQLRQAILAGDLTAGERLPSTRELARRFHLHANTVSAVYLRLDREGWLESRRGRGVYVRQRAPKGSEAPEAAVDRLLEELAGAAAKLGAGPELVRARMERWLAAPAPRRWLLVEPDAELGRIVAQELAERLRLPVELGTLEDCAGPLAGARVLVMPRSEAVVRAALPADTPVVVLTTRSIATSLSAYMPTPVTVLVGVASRWVGFLAIAETMLTAAGLPAEALLLRDTGRRGWQRGLEQAAVVIADVVTAELVPAGVRTIPFRLVAELAIAELLRTEAS